MSTFEAVHKEEAIDDLLLRSKAQPVVIFKHSNTCPISSGAYQEMQDVSVPVSLVVVQEARELSREIANRTGIRHESPQVIVLRNGKAVWSASHWEITANSVEAAVRENV
jgi:bacillithiol system protein YtxJ